MKKLALVMFLVVAATTAPVYASLIGSTVDVKADFPTMGTVFVDGGTHLVDGSVEWAAGSFPGYNSSLSVQITASQIILSFNGTATFFQTAAFNGLDITTLTGHISSAVIDASSAFNPIGISLIGNDLFLNYSTVVVGTGQLSIIDYTGTSTVPEPAGYLLAAVGLGALALVRRRAV